tara:strand:+ start:1670 stop:1849 length:180 start_codon:yes stop_codon:yes gene_type:complete
MMPKYHILISESFGITYEVEADSIKEAENKFDSGEGWEKEIDRESVDWMHVSTEEVKDE